MTGSMKTFLKATAVAMVLSGPNVSSGIAQTASGLQCGTFYRIQAGDTLRGITVRAYRHDRFLELYDANRDVLSDPARIEIGQLLFLPCPGSGPQSRTAALAANGVTPSPQDQLGTNQAAGSSNAPTALAQTTQIDALPKPGTRARRVARSSEPDREAEPQIAVVTPDQPRTPRRTPDAPLPEELLLLSARGLEPLSGPDLPYGGLIGKLIEQALTADDPATRLKTAFVNDRPAHLEVLLPLGSFALGFPWPAPDCSVQNVPHTSAMCESFDVSLPIFQVEIRVLAHAGSTQLQATAASELLQVPVCRPAGFPPVDLERQGFRQIMVKPDLDGCFELLNAGTVSLVSAPTPMITDLDAATRVSEVESLRSQEPVHALFPRNSRQSEEIRERLNRGLRQLQSSGDWFRIVSRYLSDFNANRLARKN